MNKLVSVIIFIIAAVFLAYLLIAGQVSIAWERVIIYALVVGGISLGGRIRAENLKKQDEEYFKKHQDQRQGDALGNSANPGAREGDILGNSANPGAQAGDALWKSVNPKAAEEDAAGTFGARPSVSGVVRTSIGIRGLINFLLIFIWLVILVCGALAAADGAFSDMDTIGSFGALAAVAAAATLVCTWLLNNFCCELYYTSSGVTVKKGKKEQHYSWGEIGSYSQKNYLYIFLDREGKRLFFTNSSYEGFGGFFDQYLRTHGRY